MNPRRHFVVDRTTWHHAVARQIVGKFTLLRGHRKGGKTSAISAVSGILEDAGGLALIVSLEALIFSTLDGAWLQVESRMRIAMCELAARLQRRSSKSTPPALPPALNRAAYD